MILPAPGGAFEWRRFGERSGLVCLPLAEIARHVFTARGWPLGEAPEVDEDEAWRSVAGALGDNRPVSRARQVHGAGVVLAGWNHPTADLPTADIIVAHSGRAAGVQVADCVPLLVADRGSGAVAAVHAGWRGLAARAPQVAVDALVERCGARADDLVASIGPAIGPCCYEVGPDVYQAFAQAGFHAEQLARWFRGSPAQLAGNPTLPSVVARTSHDPTRRYFDPWSATTDQLVQRGIPVDQVHVSSLCTASHPAAFCSYRRDGAGAGRFAAAIASRVRSGQVLE